jgi:hypothetical protein
MPTHRYSGDPRYYPLLGIEVEDGHEHDMEAPPADGRWQPTDSKKSRPVTKLETIEE